MPSKQHEQADQGFDAFAHGSYCRESSSSPGAGQGVENISAVSTKSMPSTASDEMTTVRVVA